MILPRENPISNIVIITINTINTQSNQSLLIVAKIIKAKDIPPTAIIVIFISVSNVILVFLWS